MKILLLCTNISYRDREGYDFGPGRRPRVMCARIEKKDTKRTLQDPAFFRHCSDNPLPNIARNRHLYTREKGFLERDKLVPDLHNDIGTSDFATHLRTKCAE